MFVRNMLLLIYALFGIIFMLGFVGDKDHTMKNKCLVGVISMGLLALVTYLLS